MIHFTDGDVALILRSIIDHNRRGMPTRNYLALSAEGMADAVYDGAYDYAVRMGMIRITGQHNGVTRKGRRYMRSATIPASHQRQGPTAWPVVDGDLDAGRMTVKSLSDLEADWLLSGPDASPDMSADADTSDM